MKLKILFIFAILTCLLSIAGAEPELKVISVELEKAVLKQGESASVTVVVKNTGDSDVLDISFALTLSNSDIDDIKVGGYSRMKSIGGITNYHIDTKRTSLAPGKRIDAVYSIKAVSLQKEEYILMFSAGGIVGKEDKWWPKYGDMGFKVYLKVELPPGSYLKEAEEYFKSGNYENAVKLAEKAKEIYINSGDNAGVMNCDKIILQSNKIIEADVAYRRAKNKMDSQDFYGALNNAEISLKIYNEIPAAESSLVSERISEIESMLAELNKTIAAREYFSDAKKYYDSGDYDNAKKHADAAKEIYREQGDLEAASKCSTIISRSEINIAKRVVLLNVIYLIGVIIFLYILHRIYIRIRQR